MTDSMDLFPGVPLVESPIFATVLPRMGLTDTERRVAVELNSRGYAVFDFPDEQLDARIDRIRSRLSPELGVDDQNPASIKVNAIRRVQDAWRFDDDVRAIAANDSVVELLSKLYGRRAFPFQTLNFPIGTQQHCHTDIVHFSSIPEKFMCGVWLAMEDIAAGAGPLCYIPGSHRWPVISNAIVGRRGWQSELDSAQTPYHDAWNALMEEHNASPEVFLARKGQALIWCANLLHGGSPQTDPTRTRWSQVTHYFFEDCLYYTPAFSDEPLGRLAFREIVSAADGSPKHNVYLDEEFGPPVPPVKAAGTRFKWPGKRRSKA